MNVSIYPYQEPKVEVTQRELQVLKYLAIGHTSEEIAKTLFLSTHTVVTHRKNLISKLGAKNTAHLLVKSFQKDVFKLGDLDID